MCVIFTPVVLVSVARLPAGNRVSSRNCTEFPVLDRSSVGRGLIRKAVPSVVRRSAPATNSSPLGLEAGFGLERSRTGDSASRPRAGDESRVLVSDDCATRVGPSGARLRSCLPWVSDAISRYHRLIDRRGPLCRGGRLRISRTVSKLLLSARVSRFGSDGHRRLSLTHGVFGDSFECASTTVLLPCKSVLTDRLS